MSFLHRVLVFCALFAVGTFAFVPSANARYSPLGFGNLVLESDAIVEGTIVEVLPETIRLQVRTVVFGPIQTSTIEVKRFRNWMCAARWAPYTAGQEVLLFLNGDGRDGNWKIRSGGGEGEMPVVEGQIYVSSVYRELAGRVASVRREIYGGSYRGYPLDRGSFLAALQQARVCFRGALASNSWRPVRVRRTCLRARPFQSAMEVRVFRALRS